MRTLLSVFLVGACFVTGPALAQRNPWVPSSLYTGNATSVDAPARAYGRATGGYIVDTTGSRKSHSDQLYDSCNSSHAVFACPGSGGE